MPANFWSGVQSCPSGLVLQYSSRPFVYLVNRYRKPRPSIQRGWGYVISRSARRSNASVLYGCKLR